MKGFRLGFRLRFRFRLRLRFRLGFGCFFRPAAIRNGLRFIAIGGVRLIRIELIEGIIPVFIGMAVDDALIGINLETFQFFRSVHGPVGIIPVDNRDGLGRAPVPVRTGVGFILGKFGSVVDQPQGVRFGL